MESHTPSISVPPKLCLKFSIINLTCYRRIGFFLQPFLQLTGRGWIYTCLLFYIIPAWKMHKRQTSGQLLQKKKFGHLKVVSLTFHNWALVSYPEYPNGSTIYLPWSTFCTMTALFNNLFSSSSLFFASSLAFFSAILLSSSFLLSGLPPDVTCFCTCAMNFWFLPPFLFFSPNVLS